jgi:hypothetical protein
LEETGDDADGADAVDEGDVRKVVKEVKKQRSREARRNRLQKLGRVDKSESVMKRERMRTNRTKNEITKIMIVFWRGRIVPHSSSIKLRDT